MKIQIVIIKTVCKLAGTAHFLVAPVGNHLFSVVAGWANKPLTRTETLIINWHGRCNNMPGKLFQNPKAALWSM